MTIRNPANSADLAILDPTCDDDDMYGIVQGEAKWSDIFVGLIKAK